MKHLFFVLFLLLAVKAGAQSWDKKTVEKSLCREWIVTRVVVDGEEQENEAAEETMTFLADHTALSSSEEAPAKWTYEESTHNLHIETPEEEESIIMTIIELSADKLTLQMGDEETLVELYFKAK